MHKKVGIQYRVNPGFHKSRNKYNLGSRDKYGRRVKQLLQSFV